MMISKNKKGSVLALATLAVVAATTCAPAHAISEAYRRQLEHNHTTQIQDATAHKTPVARFAPVHVQRYGVDFKRGADGLAYVDGKACAPDEVGAAAVTYACGLNTVIVRASGRVDLMQNGQFKGRMN